MNLSPCCPHCGKGKLFASLFKVHKQCPECGLVFENANMGDGPAYFTVLVLGIVIMVLAGIVEVKLTPPMWVHAALWIPLILGGSVLCLRLCKIYLIHLEYKLGRLHQDKP